MEKMYLAGCRTSSIGASGVFQPLVLTTDNKYWVTLEIIERTCKHVTIEKVWQNSRNFQTSLPISPLYRCRICHITFFAKRNATPSIQNILASREARYFKKKEINLLQKIYKMNLIWSLYLKVFRNGKHKKEMVIFRNDKRQ